MPSVTVHVRDLETLLKAASESYTGLEIRSAMVSIELNKNNDSGSNKDLTALLLIHASSIHDFIDILPRIYNDKTHIDYTYEYAVSLERKKENDDNRYILQYKKNIDDISNTFVSLYSKSTAYINRLVMGIEFDKIPKTLAKTIVRVMINNSDHIALGMKNIAGAILETLNDKEAKKLYAANIHKMFDLQPEDFIKILSVLPKNTVSDITVDQLSRNRTFTSVNHVKNILHIIEAVGEKERQYIYGSMAYAYNISYWSDDSSEIANGILDVVYNEILKYKKKYHIKKPNTAIENIDNIYKDITNIYELTFSAGTRSSKAADYILMALTDIKADIAAIPNNERTLLTLLFPFIGHTVKSWPDEEQSKFYNWLGNSDAQTLLAVCVNGSVGDVTMNDAFSSAYSIMRHVDVCIPCDVKISTGFITFFKNNCDPKKIKNAANALMLSV